MTILPVIGVILVGIFIADTLYYLWQRHKRAHETVQQRSARALRETNED